MFTCAKQTFLQKIIYLLHCAEVQEGQSLKDAKVKNHMELGKLFNFKIYITNPKDRERENLKQISLLAHG